MRSTGAVFILWSVPLLCSYVGEYTCLRVPHTFIKRAVDMGMDEAVAVGIQDADINRIGKEWSSHMGSLPWAAGLKNKN